MARILIGGAGGAPSNNVIRSLRESPRKDVLIGTSSVSSDLFLADVDERYVVPRAVAPEYPEAFLRLLRRAKPDFVHVQNDFEVLAISRLRERITKLGVKLFLPSSDTVENCVDKFRSYQIWKRAGLKVPETILVNSVKDLRLAFEMFDGRVWIRATRGGGGRGALPADTIDFARLWIDHFRGWGQFTAAKQLTSRTITWLSIWHKGELIVAQTRRRRSWSFGNRTLSGVTGITGVAETCAETLVDEIAEAAIRAVDPVPHGVFGVDMTYDDHAWPNPTEINVGRFFTTVYFFTKAGLNLPEIYCNLGIEGRFPTLERRLNPLPNGLAWIRGMDLEPVMTSVDDLERMDWSVP